jgi:hypothetical protein
MISRIHAITLTIITLIFNSTNREQTFRSPVHTYNILDSCPGLGMTVVHCLPIQNRQNQSNTTVSDTPGTTDSRMISCHSEKLILAGQIHQLVHNL